MGRTQHQSMKHNSYEAPTCVELNKILGKQYSLGWSKRDEVIVLEKLCEFEGQHKSANYYTSQFYNSVHKKLSVDLSQNQLCYMIYCLRKQYLENEKNSDRDDLKVVELSAKLWEVDTKTKVVSDDYYLEHLKVYVVQVLGIGADCLTSCVVEKIKEDWKEFRLVEDEFRSIQARFNLQLCELAGDMHSTQLEVGHIFRRKNFPSLSL